MNQLRDKAWLQQAYSAHTAAEIAEMLVCHPSNVTYWLRKHGIQTRNNHLGCWSEKENTTLRKLWDDNVGANEIAKRLGRSVDAVRLHARALGLPKRPGGAQTKLVYRKANGQRFKITPAIAVLTPRNGNYDSSRAARWLAEL